MLTQISTLLLLYICGLKLVSAPISITVNSSGLLKLGRFCNSTGTMNPQLRWQYDEKKPLLDERSSYHLDCRAVDSQSAAAKKEVITNQDKDSEEEYSDISTTTAQSLPTLPRVTTPPKVSVSPLLINIIPGNTFSISCKVEGDPMPTTRWFHNGSEIEHYFSTFSTSTHDLQIANASLLDIGTYECRAVSSIGTDSQTATAILAKNKPDSTSAEPIHNVTRNVKVRSSLRESEDNVNYFSITLNGILIPSLSMLILICVAYLVWLKAKGKQEEFDQRHRVTLEMDVLSEQSPLVIPAPKDSNHDANNRETSIMAARQSSRIDPVISANIQHISTVLPQDVMNRKMRYAPLMLQLPKTMEIDFKCLSKDGPILGAGNFGVVQLEVYTHSDGTFENVACKTLLHNDAEIRELVKEGTTLGRLNHPHILALKGIAFNDEFRPIIVTEFLPNGSLEDFVKNETVTIRQFLEFCEQIADGMIYLHSKHFIHRDLAARNCMLDSHNNVKIGDFGLTREGNAECQYRQNNMDIPMPVRQMALEVLQTYTFTLQSDIWSFGVLMWELMSGGAPPYTTLPLIMIQGFLEQGRRLKIPGLCPPDIFTQLMAPCWNVDANERPSFVELLRRLKTYKENSIISLDDICSLYECGTSTIYQ